MRRRLPPLENIEAFIVAASSPSFRAAADALALSPAALTRRIQSLFRPHGRETLRAPGRRRTVDGSGPEMSRRDRTRLSGIAPRDERDGTQRRKRSHEVKLSLSHSLAVGWLIPRLSSFRAEHPDIKFILQDATNASYPPPRRCRSCDLLFRHRSLRASSRAAAECPARRLPRRASQKVQRKGGPLEHYRLLAVDFAYRGHLGIWSKLTGFEIDCEAYLEFDTLHAMYEFASQDMGIAWHECHGATASGIRPPRTAWPSRRQRATAIIIMAVNAPRTHERPVATAWRWLKEEAARTSSLFGLPRGLTVTPHPAGEHSEHRKPRRQGRKVCRRATSPAVRRQAHSGFSLRRGSHNR